MSASEASDCPCVGSIDSIAFTSCCLESENGEQAISIITKKSLDLIISDYQMPLKNGLKLLENIRNDDVLNNIPFILMLIEPYEHIISQAKKLGLNDYIVRPFEEQKFKQKLEKIFFKFRF